MARREKGGDERKGRERQRKKKGRGGEVKEAYPIGALLSTEGALLSDTHQQHAGGAQLISRSTDLLIY